MDKKDFAEQIRARKEEIEELEDVVQKYARQIRNVSPLMRANMVVSFRKGVIETLEHLDSKAQEMKLKRDLKNNFIGQ